MANHLMFWRSTGLEETIRKNHPPMGTHRERRHLPCAQHSSTELAAFERSLRRPVRSPWTRMRTTKH
ncbi:hypothetical protein [Pelagibius sp.]|uniref:hypothetical protein n=1 Tax=Pelagibius sp. TaxID=1931238 RepID=UPI003B50C137